MFTLWEDESIYLIEGIIAVELDGEGIVKRGWVHHRAATDRSIPSMRIFPKASRP
jgi:hypothetical protein